MNSQATTHCTACGNPGEFEVCDTCSMQASKVNEEVEGVYEQFWKELIEVDGTIDKQKLKRELFDFWQVMQHVPRVYMYITGGLVSKLLTDPDVVMALADDVYRKSGEPITWISVSDELPDESMVVLIATPAGTEPTWLGYIDDGAWHYNNGMSVDVTVTAWAELPSGPQRSEGTPQ